MHLVLRAHVIAVGASSIRRSAEKFGPSPFRVTLLKVCDTVRSGNSVIHSNSAYLRYRFLWRFLWESVIFSLSAYLMPRKAPT